MAENHHDLDRLYQPAPEEGFDELDRAAYDHAAESLDRGDAFAFLSDVDADALWNDGDREEWEDCMDDAEADADTFRSIGWGTDEDYGYFGGDE